MFVKYDSFTALYSAKEIVTYYYIRGIARLRASWESCSFFFLLYEFFFKFEAVCRGVLSYLLIHF